MNQEIKIFSHPDFKIKPEHLIFKYKKELTEKLENIQEIDQNVINEIVLWKLNRNTNINFEVFDLITNVKGHSKLDVEFTSNVISKLLLVDGIRLPMASTILRFANPKIYQIIDQRVYRILYGKKLQIRLNHIKNLLQITQMPYK